MIHHQIHKDNHDLATMDIAMDIIMAMDMAMDITVDPPGHRSRQAEASLCQRRRPHSQSTTENQKL